MKNKIVLASTSRYRAELLQRLKIPFEVTQPDVDETPLENERPVETALRLSVAKSRNVAGRYTDGFIIGSDQVADLNGSPIGKPGTLENARQQLTQMRGQTMIFHTGVAIINVASGRTQSLVVPTTVRFRDYSNAELERYLAIEPALDCAGSAKSEGLGIALIASMTSDDPTALVGLPLIALTQMLRDEGYEVLA